MRHTIAAPPPPLFPPLRRGAALLRDAVLGRPVVAILLLVCVFATARYETFSTPANLLNVLRQNSMVGLLALGMMFAMLSGGIDLSLGAMLAVGAVTAAALSEWGSVAAVGGAVGATGLLGLANGMLVARARIQPFIATLVTNMASRGVLLAYTHEEVVRVAKSAGGLKWAGRGWVGPIPAPVVVLFAAYAVAGGVLAYTRFGRHVRAAGDNDEAARLMGLDVVGVRTLVYAVSGALGGWPASSWPGDSGSASRRRAWGWS